MNYTRREFLASSALSGVGLFTLGTEVAARSVTVDQKPAILGGNPAHPRKWSEWPIWRPDQDEPRVVEVLRAGSWSRGAVTEEFEEKYAKLIGAKRCLATTNGTHALIVSLHMAGVGPGDEVLVTPYTFIATIDAILMNNAMPIFVDVDPATYQIDPGKIEDKITDRTKAILPVHILGLPADMHRIMTIADQHDLVVIEDACQAWLAQINHQNVGTFGHAGCFSFQNSKHLPIGEGGAIVSNSDEFMDRCFSFHNFGRPYGNMVGKGGGDYVMVGTKCRFTEYQAAIGLSQMTRLQEQTVKRWNNALYLKEQIQDIPGIQPFRLYDGVTRAAFHLFPFRYKKEEFENLSRKKFMQALKAEGIPCSGGYRPLNTMPYLKQALSSRAFQLAFSEEALDYSSYLKHNHCPENENLCDEMVWIYQFVLLGSQLDMEDVASAIRKIRTYASVIEEY